MEKEIVQAQKTQIDIDREERLKAEFKKMVLQTNSLDYLLRILPFEIKKDALMCRDFKERSITKKSVQQIANKYNVYRENVYRTCKG